MKVFISHNMSSVDEETVKKIRAEATEYLRNIVGPDVEIIDNYTHEDAPENADRLWHLGRSIQQIGGADAIYFVPGFSDANGCIIERQVALLYNLEVLDGST